VVAWAAGVADDALLGAVVVVVEGAVVAGVDDDAAVEDAADDVAAVVPAVAVVAVVPDVGLDDADPLCAPTAMAPAMARPPTTAPTPVI